MHDTGRCVLCDCVFALVSHLYTLRVLLFSLAMLLFSLTMRNVVVVVYLSLSRHPCQ